MHGADEALFLRTGDVIEILPVGPTSAPRPVRDQAFLRDYVTWAQGIRILSNILVRLWSPDWRRPIITWLHPEQVWQPGPMTFSGDFDTAYPGRWVPIIWSPSSILQLMQVSEQAGQVSVLYECSDITRAVRVPVEITGPDLARFLQAPSTQISVLGVQAVMQDEDLHLRDGDIVAADLSAVEYRPIYGWPDDEVGQSDIALPTGVALLYSPRPALRLFLFLLCFGGHSLAVRPDSRSRSPTPDSDEWRSGEDSPRLGRWRPDQTYPLADVLTNSRLDYQILCPFRGGLRSIAHVLIHSPGQIFSRLARDGDVLVPAASPARRRVHRYSRILQIAASGTFALFTRHAVWALVGGVLLQSELVLAMVESPEESTTGPARVGKYAWRVPEPYRVCDAAVVGEQQAVVISPYGGTSASIVVVSDTPIEEIGVQAAASEPAWSHAITPIWPAFLDNTLAFLPVAPCPELVCMLVVSQDWYAAYLLPRRADLAWILAVLRRSTPGPLLGLCPPPAVSHPTLSHNAALDWRDGDALLALPLGDACGIHVPPQFQTALHVRHAAFWAHDFDVLCPLPVVVWRPGYWPARTEMPPPAHWTAELQTFAGRFSCKYPGRWVPVPWAYSDEVHLCRRSDYESYVNVVIETLQGDKMVGGCYTVPSWTTAAAVIQHSGLEHRPLALLGHVPTAALPPLRDGDVLHQVLDDPSPPAGQASHVRPWGPVTAMLCAAWIVSGLRTPTYWIFVAVVAFVVAQDDKFGILMLARFAPPLTTCLKEEARPGDVVEDIRSAPARERAAWESFPVWSGGLAARRQYLYAQMLQCTADVVCLQEARSRAGRWAGTGYLTWRSGALKGQYSCEIWIRTAAVQSPMQLQNWSILYSVPRILCVSSQLASFPLTVVSAHAPHADRPDREAVLFWRELTAVVRRAPRHRALVVGIDANADFHASDSEELLIGDLLSSAEQGRNDEMLMEFCLTTGLEAPATFSSTQRGPELEHVGARLWQLLPEEPPAATMCNDIVGQLCDTYDSQIKSLPKRPPVRPRQPYLAQATLDAFAYLCEWRSQLRTLQDQLRRTVLKAAWRQWRGDQSSMHDQLHLQRLVIGAYCLQERKLQRRVHDLARRDKVRHLSRLTSTAAAVWHSTGQPMPAIVHLKWASRRAADRRAVFAAGGYDIQEALEEQFRAQEGGMQVTPPQLEAKLRAWAFTPAPCCHSALPTLSDMEYACLRQRGGKAPGPDGIPNEVWRMYPPQAGRWLWQLCSRITVNGREPSRFKKALQHALYKKGPAALPANYRSIALLNGVAKLWHGHLRSTIGLSLLSRYDPLQLGGRKGVPVSFAVMTFRNVWDFGVQRGRCSAALFVDVQAAYYETSRQLLFHGDASMQSPADSRLWHLAELVHELATHGALAALGTPPEELALFLDCVSCSHWQLVGSDRVYVATRGSRPGDGLADILFGALFAVALRHIRAACRSEQIWHASAGALIGRPNEVVPIGWADDLAVLADFATPVELQSRLPRLADIVISTLEFLRFRVNLGPGKTEAIVDIRGDAARKVKSDMLAHASELLLPDGRAVRLAPEYRYLGVIQQPRDNGRRDQELSLQRAQAAWVQARGLFSSSSLPIPLKRAWLAGRVLPAAYATLATTLAVLATSVAMAFGCRPDYLSSFLAVCVVFWGLPAAWHRYWTLWSAAEHFDKPFDFRARHAQRPIRAAADAQVTNSGCQVLVMLAAATVTFKHICSLVVHSGMLWIPGVPCASGLSLLRRLLPDAVFHVFPTAHGRIFVAAHRDCAVSSWRASLPAVVDAAVSPVLSDGLFLQPSLVYRSGSLGTG
ncbi:hypothetical protein AK812_SmicGene26670 [Symbiodinium microadriaticum]|uniref:Endonuclease/exonuclease/phosphatase domain-containing protein n=1 Tax=Symbiodinium microadriaticum TaxID=2951 RepID=A0A1Q9D8Z2_SYMMI|nr:hypothetical protein AK812_SmicGene26670 [Symbiodinium microadriaticum]CAE7663339.1 unnamed protein product [Symbiodinium microadriaticum]CAE7949265.1 unnamed protein product [Symbiodinium sp. KB8]